MPKLVVLNDDGSYQEVQTVSVSSGNASQGKVPELNASGMLDSSMVPATGGGPTKSFVIAMSIALG